MTDFVSTFWLILAVNLIINSIYINLSHLSFIVHISWEKKARGREMG